MSKHCDQLPEAIDGHSIDEVPSLADAVCLSDDPMTWISIYRCRLCDQLWEQRFRGAGHADVPMLRKLSSLPEELVPPVPIPEETPDTIPGWSFRVDEISPGQYRACGIDSDGAAVQAIGPDPVSMLAKVKRFAFETYTLGKAQKG